VKTATKSIKVKAKREKKQKAGADPERRFTEQVNRIIRLEEFEKIIYTGYDDQKPSQGIGEAVELRELLEIENIDYANNGIQYDHAIQDSFDAPRPDHV
jgi:hypothetical protein